MPSTKKRPLEERFWEKVDVTDVCWWWIGGRSEGYGRIARKHRRDLVFAHRLVYEWFWGPIPEGLTIDHLCYNRACVNPYHLEAVSHVENIMRGNSPPARNARKTVCAYGHPYEGDNIIRVGRHRQCAACVKRNGQRAD